MSKVRKFPTITHVSGINPTPSRDTIEKIADVQQALNDGVNTITNEIRKIRIRSKLTEAPISKEEFKLLVEGVKVLLTAERQQIEATKLDELKSRAESMSTQDLIELAKSFETPAAKNE